MSSAPRGSAGSGKAKGYAHYSDTDMAAVVKKQILVMEQY